MFGNQNQSSNNGNNGFNNQVNVTTRLYNSYSDTAALNVSAWNEQISIRLSPFRGKSPEGIRLYSQDNNECIQTALTMDNVSALLEGINDTIIPSLEDKTPGVVAVMVGTMANKKIVAIDTDGTDVELTIYVGVDEENKAQEGNSIAHKFNKKEWISGYNPANGSGEIHESNADFTAFTKKLEEVYKLSSGVIHALKKQEAYKNSYSGSNNKNYNNTSNSGYQASVANAGTSNMSDFIPFE
jgi:hypothetical protein